MVINFYDCFLGIRFKDYFSCLIDLFVHYHLIDDCFTRCQGVDKDYSQDGRLLPSEVIN